MKAPFKDIFGNDIPALYVKGSGWDLASIEKEGFAPVSVLRHMRARMSSLLNIFLVSPQISFAVGHIYGFPTWSLTCQHVARVEVGHQRPFCANL